MKQTFKNINKGIWKSVWRLLTIIFSSFKASKKKREAARVLEYIANRLITFAKVLDDEADKQAIDKNL